ncbi:MAG TPA: biotin/lipoyl-containing protein, partial [Flavisolibacter sp.]|nr:biotin/lipoyl-containing protein [Flavisolibacter sp.]
MIDIKVPTVGESINEVTLIKWLKKSGDYVERDEVIAELESEKATFEVNAEKAGVLKTVGNEGDTLHIGDTLAQIDETVAKPEGAKQAAPEEKNNSKMVAAEVVKEKDKQNQQPAAPKNATPVSNDIKATPVASAIIAENKVDPKN